MPSFNLAVRGGESIPTKYSPLIYSRMSSVYKFALHKVGRNWVVSHIESGAKICTVKSHYKGMLVSSGDLPLKHARLCAIADIDSIVDRVGFEKFDATINNPKPF